MAKWVRGYGRGGDDACLILCAYFVQRLESIRLASFEDFWAMQALSEVVLRMDGRISVRGKDEMNHFRI